MTIEQRAKIEPAVESRTTPLPVELRSAGTSGGSGRRIGGMAAVFNSRSEPMNGFVEQVDQRFFNKSRGDGWPGAVARFQHSDMAILGTVQAGTLRLTLDDVGLAYEVDLPNTSVGNDVHELVQRQDVPYSSFSFIAYDDIWGYADGAPLRTLLSGRLIDVSPVSQPAYRSTNVAALRSLARAVGAPYEDVVDYAARDELRKFLTRTDIDGGKRLSGRQAYLETLRRRWPAAPLSGDGGSRPMSGRQALLATEAKRWTTPQPSKPLTGRQAQLHLLLNKRFPPY